MWAPGLDLLQVYDVSLPVVRPALSAELDDTSDRRWVTWSELGELCGDLFWWPLAEALFNPPAW